jgi:hypothetical protein
MAFNVMTNMNLNASVSHVAVTLYGLASILHNFFSTTSWVNVYLCVGQLSKLTISQDH